MLQVLKDTRLKHKGTSSNLHNFVGTLLLKKKKDSMLRSVCSVIDRRWCQNVVRTNKWHTRQKPSVSLMFLPHFDVLCDLLLNRHMATWNLFVIYNKGTKYYSFFLFQNLSQLLESRQTALANTIKSHLT